jgi:hypothetical protein
MKQQMRTVNFEEYNRAAKRDLYLKGSINRWTYYEKVIDIIKRENPKSVLELGPRTLPIVNGSDTMDKIEHIESLTFLHDATKFPWPINNSSYDMFIALQVWEYLKGKQQEAFEEVIRISKKAIISFPYKWIFTTRISHWNINDRKIKKWTLNIRPVEVHIKARRAIYFFEFDK